MSLTTNKQAKRFYDVLSTITSGISLLGTEVKSLRRGNGSLVGAQILLRGGEAFLVGANIPPYQGKNLIIKYDEKRTRKLLLNKKELLDLKNKVESKKLTLIPLSIYNKGRLLKLEIGLGKKKLVKSKKEEIKKRDFARDLKKEW